MFDSDRESGVWRRPVIFLPQSEKKRKIKAMESTNKPTYPLTHCPTGKNGYDDNLFRSSDIRFSNI